jgi:hypothetical protein
VTHGKRRVKRYLVDTGSPNDLIGENCIPKGATRKKLPSNKRLSLDTAGGEKHVDSVAAFDCSALSEKIEPLLLTGCAGDALVVLSIGKRVMNHGYDFIWRTGHRPYFRKPDGTKVSLEVDDDVPYLIEDKVPRKGRKARVAAAAVPVSVPGYLGIFSCRSPAYVATNSPSNSESSGHGSDATSSYSGSGSDIDDLQPVNYSRYSQESDGSGSDYSNVSSDISDQDYQSGRTYETVAFTYPGPRINDPKNQSLDYQEEGEEEEEVSERDDTDSDHQVSHRKKRADCRGCSAGKASRTRKTRKKSDRKSKNPEHFGQVTLDYIICHSDEKDWGWDH